MMTIKQLYDWAVQNKAENLPVFIDGDTPPETYDISPTGLFLDYEVKSINGQKPDARLINSFPFTSTPSAAGMEYKSEPCSVWITAGIEMNAGYKRAEE